MAMAYQWKPDARCTSVEAQVVGNILDEINEREGCIKPEHLVERAKPKDSPIHQMFEWRDREAACQYRLEQARAIIRSITIETIPNDRAPVVVRAFVAVQDQETPTRSVYLPTVKAFEHEPTRQEVLTRAYQELMAWRRKYANLLELAKVVEVIDKLAI